MNAEGGAGRVAHPLIVVQPTPFCNLDCTYCYLPDRANQRRMTLQTLVRIADQVFSSPRWSGVFTFLWHLGEPLALPVDYYEAAFQVIAEAAQRHQRRYAHSFQTNATLIDARWVAFFRRQRPQLGVSLDGPACFHDRQRRTRSGGGSHAQTMAGVARLQEAELPFGVICVLTARALDHPEALFDFFLQNRIRELAFNIDEIEGAHQQSSFAPAGARERYTAFLRRFVELVGDHHGVIHLRELWRHLPMILRGAAPYNLANQALRIVTFDCDGNYSTFCPELRAARSRRYGDFVMGNVHREGLRALEQSPVFGLVQAEVAAGIAACQERCAYWRLCGGGEPSSKFFEHGRFDVTETLSCRVHQQATVDAILGYLESLAPGAPPAWLAEYASDGRT